MTGPSELQQKQKILQQIQKIEKSSLGTMSKETLDDLEIQNYKAMSAGALQMRRLGIEFLDPSGDIMLEAIETQQLPQMQDSIQRKESAKKKKKDQEADALKRAKEKNIQTKTALAEQLLQGRRNFLEHEREHVIPDDWKEIRVGMNGKEFVPDPQTKQVDIEGLLHKYRLLNAKVAAYKKNQKNANLKEQSMMEVNMEILELMNDAIHTWSAAGGVDMKSGKEISASKQKDAKQHLELAMERYRDAMENSANAVGQRYLEKLQKQNKKQYKESIKAFEERDIGSSQAIIGMKLNIASINKDDVTAIRSWISENPEQYRANKAMVDKIYQEFLSNAQTMNQKMQHIQAMQRMLPSSYGMNSVEAMAAKALKKMQEENSLRLSLQERQKDALNYLLRGREPETPFSHTFLEQRWGIVTAKQAEQKQTMEGQEQVVAAQDAEMLAAFESAKEIYRQKTAELQAAVEKDPQNKELQNMLLRFTRYSLDHITLGNLLTNLNALSTRNVELTKLTDMFMHQKIQKIDGSVSQDDSMNAAQYRDMAKMMTPSMGELKVPTLEQLNAACNTVHILETGVHMNGKQATENEVLSAFLEESGSLAECFEDLTAYTKANTNIYYKANVSSAELFHGFGQLFDTHARAQTLTKRVDMLMKHPLFSTLPGEKQAEIKKMRYFFGGLMTYTRSVQATLNAKAKHDNQTNYIFGQSLYSFIEKHKLMLQ